MIGRLFALVRRVSLRQLVNNPRAELGRILRWVGRRVEWLGNDAISRGPKLPAWLHEEMIALASIEPELLGEQGNATNYRFYDVPVANKPGELYRQLVAEVGPQRPSHVLIVPWLVRGGADRGALHHLQAWVELLPARSTLLIVTEDVVSPWLDRVPVGVRVLRFGRIVGGMELEGKVQLMVRLLVQMQPDVIHTINSRVAWQSVRTHGLALRQRSRLFASLFCDDLDEHGVPVGYARSYLRSCATHLSGVFCDNSVYPDLWARELGVSRRLFTVLRFPYDRVVVRKEDAFAIKTTPRVLWAGRFHHQKRPDILLAIATEMPSVTFDVHGVSELDKPHPAIKTLCSLPNVVMHRAFAHFDDIVTHDHAAYLFTSSWEGLPTILLDAAAAGVPIVAPAVGGIVDLIEPSKLIDHPENVAAFVKQLQQLIADPALRRARRERQYARLSAGRGWEAFTRALREVPNYLREPTAPPAQLGDQGRRT